jgi:Cu-Zn family superoxide dismutase
MLNVYDAIAHLKGSSFAPDVYGTVKFLKIADGTWVEAEVFGLPDFAEGTDGKPQTGPFAFHLHEYDTCGEIFGDSPFQAAGEHWNPDGEPHGNHAGDFPVLFSNGGTAKMLFFTNRFFPEDVVGRSVVVHQSPDDYKTQPSMGGKRIACGAIVASQTPELPRSFS